MSENRDIITIGMVCEARADYETAAGLADRVLCEHERLKSSLNVELLPHVRAYSGPDETQKWFTWSEMKDLARRANIEFHGHFNKQPHAPDAVMVVRAIRVLRRLFNVDTMMLIRDDDGIAARRMGFEQARTQEETRYAQLTIVVGLATTKRECWALAGFEPRDDVERERLQDERQTLGFDPREEAHRLTAKHDPANDKLSAKRVLWALTNKDHEREKECWKRTDLDVMRQRGQDSGLSDFLAEVEHRLAPLLMTSR